jgi:hypothetical protein
LHAAACPAACRVRTRWLGESTERIGRHYPETAAALRAAGEIAIANVTTAASEAPVNAPALLSVRDRLL